MCFSQTENIGNLIIYRSVVGARLGHGWGMIGAKTQIIWGMVGARGMAGARLGQGWDKVGAWLGQESLGQG